MKPLAIIGVDPGTTAAYAILDLQGNILHHYAAKELTLAEMISHITERCFPLIVSTDKAKVPSFVDEFARKVGAEIVAPPEDMKREEKRIMLLAKEVHYNGAHEHDAMAAALFAYHKYLPTFKKIDRFIEEHQLGDQRIEFTKIAVHENLHFSMIKEILTKPSVESAVMQRAVLDNRITKKDFMALYGKLNVLREEKWHLVKQIEEQNQKIQDLSQERRYFSQKSTDFDRRVDYILEFKEKRLHLQEKELQQQQTIIFQLQQEMLGLYHFIEQSPNLQLVKKIPNLGAQEFEAHRILNIRSHDILLVQTTDIYSENVIELLRGLSVTILSFRKPSPFISSLFITAHVAPSDIVLDTPYFCLINPHVLEQKREQKDMVDKVVREYKDDRTR